MSRPFHFEPFVQDMLDFEALRREAAENPIRLLDACKKRQKAIEAGTRYLKWDLFVSCYAAALVIKKHPHLFEDLKKHPFFKERAYKSNFKDVLRHCMLIGTNASATGPSYKNACYSAKCLQSFYNDDVDPESVMQNIETAKGLKGLLKINGDAENCLEPTRVRKNENDVTPTLNIRHRSIVPTPRKRPAAFNDRSGSVGDQIKIVSEAHEEFSDGQTDMRIRDPGFKPDCRDQKVDLGASNTDISFDAGLFFEEICSINNGNEVVVVLQRTANADELRRFKAVRVKISNISEQLIDDRATRATPTRRQPRRLRSGEGNYRLREPERPKIPTPRKTPNSI